MNITLEMTFKKSTKNTHVYEADFEGAEIPTLYIMRESMPDKPPADITVTVKLGDS